MGFSKHSTHRIQQRYKTVDFESNKAKMLEIILDYTGVDSDIIKLSQKLSLTRNVYDIFVCEQWVRCIYNKQSKDIITFMPQEHIEKNKKYVPRRDIFPSMTFTEKLLLTIGDIHNFKTN